MGFLNCPLLTPFILNLTRVGEFSVTISSVQYDLLQRPIILSPLNSTLKSPGVRLPWGVSGVQTRYNQLCLFRSNSSRSSGLIKSSTFSAVIPR